MRSGSFQAVIFGGLFFGALSLAGASAEAAVCSGAANCLDMTILPTATPPSQLLDVSLHIADITENSPPPLAWSSFESWTIAHPNELIGNSDQLHTTIVPHLVWIVPGGKPNDLPNDKFDFFTFLDDGNRGTSDIDLSENVSYFDLFNPNGALYDTFRTCYFGGPVTGCPVLTMGQSYTVPANYSDGNLGQVYSTFTVTLNSGVTVKVEYTCPRLPSL